LSYASGNKDPFRIVRQQGRDGPSAMYLQRVKLNNIRNRP